MSINAMNIFITGASGFVGGAAARRLAAEGHRVRAMSRSSSSDQTPGLVRRYVRSLLDGQKAVPPARLATCTDFLLANLILFRYDDDSRSCHHPFFLLWRGVV
jgi:nucleoside-diphosphate-sugar epimerase